MSWLKRRKQETLGYLAEVEIYTTRYCGYCYRAKELLDDKGVAYREIACDRRPDLRQQIRQASGQRTVPQIFINGVAIGGHRELSALERQGRLDALLRRAPQRAS
jgi:glutaredoxin 3